MATVVWLRTLTALSCLLKTVFARPATAGALGGWSRGAWATRLACNDRAPRRRRGPGGAGPLRRRHGRTGRPLPCSPQSRPRPPRPLAVRPQPARPCRSSDGGPGHRPDVEDDAGGKGRPGDPGRHLGHQAGGPPNLSVGLGDRRRQFRSGRRRPRVRPGLAGDHPRLPRRRPGSTARPHGHSPDVRPRRGARKQQRARGDNLPPQHRSWRRPRPGLDARHRPRHRRGDRRDRGRLGVRADPGGAARRPLGPHL